MDNQIKEMKTMRVKSKHRIFETVDHLEDRPVIRGHQALKDLRDGRAQKCICDIIPSANIRILENEDDIIVDKRMKDGIAVGKKPKRHQDEDVDHRASIKKPMNERQEPWFRRAAHELENEYQDVNSFLILTANCLI